MEKEYALYKGDDLVGIGTMRKLAESMGIKLSTVQYYHTPTYKKRALNAKKPVIFVPLN